jgi:hypothetical protein
VIVLTSLPDGEPQDRARHLGALLVLSKPVRLSQLMDEIKAMGNREFSGQVRGISLGSLLQLMALDAKTCTITVRSGEQIGHLYVKSGRLIHAISPTEEGLLAAFVLLGWESPWVEFVNACRVEPSFDIATEELLLNLAMFQDHQSRVSIARKPDDPWIQS